MKPESVNIYKSSFAIQTQNFRLFNFDANKKHIFEYILGFIIFKK